MSKKRRKKIISNKLLNILCVFLGFSYLFFITNKTKDIDKDKCIMKYNEQYDKEKALIEWIKANKIKVLNSGIKIA